MATVVVLAVALTGGALTLAPGAAASQIIGRNVTSPSLEVDAEGRAGVSYVDASGRARRVLVWGAVDANHPQAGARQVVFRVDYAGGRGAFRRDVVATLVNACTPLRLPSLPWVVSTCRAPDGSYWALQRWQRKLPNLGLLPWKEAQAAWELHISHWSGNLAELEVSFDTVGSRRFHRLFGRLTYRGRAVYGFDATPTGSPLDGWGRNLYLDTFDSAYGLGWRRENSFLARTGTGTFCYGFFPHDPYPGYPTSERRPPGHGTRYRITVLGPGVTPAIGWEGPGLPNDDDATPGAVDGRDVRPIGCAG